MPRLLQEPFCERYFGTFFAVWGALLIAEHCLEIHHQGVFLGKLDSYLPAWAWGALLLFVGLGRRVASRCHHVACRIAFSVATLALMTAIAAVAWWSGLWAAVAPISSFVAVMAFWCHKALLRDIRLGL